MASLQAHRRVKTAIERRLALAVAYLALFVASFWPQSVHLWDRIGYVGDSLAQVYVVGWDAHILPRAPWRALDAPFCHPERSAITLAEHLLAPSLLVAPVVWLTDNPVLGYNLALVLATLLAAFGGRHLAKTLGADEWGAFAAGALFAFNTFRVNEAPRLHIVMDGFHPLIVAALIRLFLGGTRRAAWTVASLCLLLGFSSNYHLLYACFVISLLSCVALAARPRASVRTLRALVVPGLVAGALFLPIAMPYLLSARRLGHTRALPTGIDLVHYLTTTPTNLFYGHLGTVARLQQRAPHFVGFVSIALVMVALWAGWRRRGTRTSSVLPERFWVPVAAGLIVFFVLLSFGRDIVAFGRPLGPGPYGLVFNYFPGFKLVRIPERMGILAMMFIAMLVAQAITWIRAGGGRWVGAALAILVPLEHVSPLPLTMTIPSGRNVPEVYRWLAERKTAAVAEVPIYGEGLIRKESLDMYFSLFHGKPTVHGYVSFPPLSLVLTRRAAGEFPSPLSLQILNVVGVDTVVFHSGRPGAEAMEPLLREAENAATIERIARFPPEQARAFDGGFDEVYRIASAPQIEQAPFPVGTPLAPGAWRLRAKLGDPRLVADGDAGTAWSTARPIQGDEFVEIRFDRPRLVSGVVLKLRWDSVLPSRFRVTGADPEGRWREIALSDDAHLLQLFASARRNPASPTVGFAVRPRLLSGVALQPLPGAYGHEGWRLPEIEVLTP